MAMVYAYMKSRAKAATTLNGRIYDVTAFSETLHQTALLIRTAREPAIKLEGSWLNRQLSRNFLLQHKGHLLRIMLTAPARSKLWRRGTDLPRQVYLWPYCSRVGRERRVGFYYEKAKSQSLMVNGKRSLCGMNSDVLFSKRNFLENKNTNFLQ